MKIRVQVHSGYKSNRRPMKFWIGETAVFVESIEDEWLGLDSVYFRVTGDDGNSYVLRYAETTEEWTIEKHLARG